VGDLVKEIRSCDSLEELAERITEEQKAANEGRNVGGDNGPIDVDSPASQSSIWAEESNYRVAPSLEAELSGKMGALRLEEGQVRFIGATSSLMLLPTAQRSEDELDRPTMQDQREDIPLISWTKVTQDKELITHLIVCHRPPLAMGAKSPVR
jgi:hypothetical protein